jgi:hypothetical protein
VDQPPAESTGFSSVGHDNEVDARDEPVHAFGSDGLEDELEDDDVEDDDVGSPASADSPDDEPVEDSPDEDYEFTPDDSDDDEDEDLTSESSDSDDPEGEDDIEFEPWIPTGG